MDTIGFAIDLTIKEPFLNQLDTAIKGLGRTPIYFSLQTNPEPHIIGAERFKEYKFVVVIGHVKSIDWWEKKLFPQNAVVWFDSERFDQSYYAPYLGDLMLNPPSKVSYKAFNEVFSSKYDHDIFIKPCRDLKAFSGQVIKAGQIVGSTIMNGVLSNLTYNEPIIIAPVVDIITEFRCFFVGWNLVASSIYKQNGEIYYKHTTVPQQCQLVDFILKINPIYVPADVFVVDVALTKDGFKVIEYNCLNCSAHYKANSYYLFEEIIHYLNIKSKEC